MTTVSLVEAPAAIQSYASGSGRPVILLDGGSGAGKTSLAARVAASWRATRGEELQVVSLDDVYPGWDGLAAGSAAVTRILAGSNAGYRRWDWDRSRPAAWVSVDPHRPILVEGCGALTVASAPARVGHMATAIARLQALAAEPVEATAPQAEASAS